MHIMLLVILVVLHLLQALIIIEFECNFKSSSFLSGFDWPKARNMEGQLIGYGVSLVNSNKVHFSDLLID